MNAAIQNFLIKASLLFSLLSPLAAHAQGGDAGQRADFSPNVLRQELAKINETASNVCNEGSGQCRVAKDATRSSSDTTEQGRVITE